MYKKMLDSERSRNQRQGSESFSREVEFMRWFPLPSLQMVFLTNVKRALCPIIRVEKDIREDGFIFPLFCAAIHMTGSLLISKKSMIIGNTSFPSNMSKESCFA